MNTTINEKSSSKLYSKDTGKFAIVFLLTIALVIGLVLVLSRYTRTIVTQQNMTYLESASENSEKYIDTIFVNAQRDLVSTTYLYGQKMTSPKVDHKDLRMLAENSSFKYLYFVDKNGKVIDREGKTSNLAKREYFNDGMAGNSGNIAVKNSFFHDGETIFLFYSPLYYKGEILGLFLGIFGEEFIADLLRRNIFDEECLVFLCLEDGTIFTDSGAKSYDVVKKYSETANLLDYFKANSSISEEDLENLKNCFSSSGKCHFTYKRNNGKSETAFALNSMKNTWTLVQMFPESITERMMHAYNKIAIQIELICAVVFALYVLFFVLSELRQRKLIETGTWKIIKKGSANLTDTISAVSDNYYKILKINLDTGTYESIKVDETEHTETTDVYDWMKEMAELNYIAEENKKEFLEFYKPEEFKSAFLSGKEKFTIKYKRKIKGLERWVKMEVKKSTEFSEENPIAVLYVLDINDDIKTELALREAFEAATKANKAKTSFLSSMSHDIRTPMNAIIGMTAIASVNLDDKKKVSGCLEKINDSSKHLLGLINEVLDMSKIESGHIDLQDEEFDIVELSKNSIEMCKNLAKEKNHNVNVMITNIQHENVIGDAQRIQQVFLNLISNAIKYTPDNGQIDISITERATEKPKIACFEFIFQDNGIGMSEEYQKHLFEPFTRDESDERVKKQQGTGLGMPITKNIVQMMNGDIKVESKLNEGTKFTVTIFLQISEDEITKDAEITNDETEKKEVNLADFAKNDYSGHKALLVEDNEINAEIATEILSMAKLEIERAENGKVAVDMFNEKPEDYYSIIFMDIQMPVMNGHDSSRAIRASDKNYAKTVPIIAMTANAFSDDIVAAKNSGMNEHIAKPLKIDLIAKTLNKYLGGGWTPIAIAPHNDEKQ